MRGMDPANAASVVVSLTSWQGNRDAVDEYLRNSQTPNQAQSLKEALDSIKKCSNTEKVFPVSKYDETTPSWNAVMNENMSHLFRTVISFAKARDTGTVNQQTRLLTFGALGFLFLAVGVA